VTLLTHSFNSDKTQ